MSALSACGGGGGSSSPPAAFQPPIGPSWTQFYGSGVNIVNGSFDIPVSPGSIHYIAEPHAATLGQTVTLKFQITGSGTFGLIDTTDTLPATISLFLWETGDPGTCETCREWTGRTALTGPGTYTLTAKIDPSLWSGVQGQTPSAAAFQQLLNNLYGAGFTFGGSTHSNGHGIYSATGLFHFTLISFTIQ